jgi:hypothetical protein
MEKGEVDASNFNYIVNHASHADRKAKPRSHKAKLDYKQSVDEVSKGEHIVPFKTIRQAELKVILHRLFPPHFFPR